MDDIEKLIRYGFVDRSPGPLPEGSVLVKVQTRVVRNAHPRASHFEVSTQDHKVSFLTPMQDHEPLQVAMNGKATGYYWAEVSNGHIHINTQLPVDDGEEW